MRTLPRIARATVGLFGIIGAYGLIRAILMIGPVDYGYFGLLVFLAVVTGRTKVRLIGGSSLSLMTTVVLVAMFMLGTSAAILVGVCGVIAQAVFPWRKFMSHHLIFNLGMIVLTISVASAGYYAVVHNLHPTAMDRLLGSLIASIIYYLGCSVCVSMIVGLSGKKSIFWTWHDTVLYTAPSFVIGGLLAFLVSQFAFFLRATVLLVVVPILYLCYYSYRVYIESLEKEKQHAGEMAELFNSTLSTLVLAIDAKDKNTHGHIQRVQRYARAIAEAMHLGDEEIKAIAAAALLHDIGKLAVPEYILSKQGPLTPDEMRKMRMHPQLGADIISNIKFPYPVADSILAHHERFDGSGYPKGLCGKDIPLGARVLAVADVFDAYTSDRIECAETLTGAMQAIREGSGTFFDPEIVRVWESIYRAVVTWSTTASSTAYTDIQRATSEIKILEELTQSLAKVTTFEEVGNIVAELVKKRFPDCSAELKPGEHDGVPVVFEGKVIATICVGRRGTLFTDDEIGMVRAIAENIAGTLSKAMALEIARIEATIDKLTGLANRRAFEMAAVSLDHESVSIVLIDVNAFKGVNDTFGHKAGDAVLMRIGAHMRAAFQDAELTCRLGGDEFVVLSHVDNRTLRMQIRNFRRMVVWDPAHEPYKKMMFGVSCGLAAIPADGQDIEQAMHCADERMYAVKARFKQFACRATAVV
ncbi:MAG TPA: HD domain-containing phosphohydrolase [Terriglobia bacterium]|nr:HD domain-containing phosphohydrolase [Terriglobia bacterium]